MTADDFFCDKHGLSPCRCSEPLPKRIEVIPGAFDGIPQDIRAEVMKEFIESVQDGTLLKKSQPLVMLEFDEVVTLIQATLCLSGTSAAESAFIMAGVFMAFAHERGMEVKDAAAMIKVACGDENAEDKDFENFVQKADGVIKDLKSAEKKRKH